MVSPTYPSDLWIRGCGWPPAGGPHSGAADLPRLLCFPHAGGSASFYRPLARHVGDAAEVLAVQYPGRQDRRAEPPITTVDGLADAISDQLRGWTDRPLVLFGHSMGATVAYEVARRLERGTGTPPLGLFASGRRAPSAHAAQDILGRGDQGLIDDLRRFSGTEPSLLDDEEVLAMVLPVLRADYEAIESYRHRPGQELGCPIIALVGEDDARAALDDVRAWKAHTTAGFDLRVFAGGHFYLSEQWPAVGEAIRSGIALFDTATGPSRPGA